MIDQKPKYSYCDLQIVPSSITTISSRSECNARYEDIEDGTSMLPLFAAPMDSVADDKNYKKFNENGITPIIHRNVSAEKRLKLTIEGQWCAYDMEEVDNYFANEDSVLYKESVKTFKVLIDCASGHMERVFSTVRNIKDVAKSKDKTLVVMTGNIGNSEAYEMCCDSGIDYVRCSIGTGSMCLTTANSAVGYPPASLIDELNTKKQNLKYLYPCGKDREDFPHFTFTKIVADGGIRNYSDAVIALALGADYVMIGGIFASFLESCADIVPRELKPGEKKGIMHSQNPTQRDEFTFLLPKSMKEAIADYEELSKKYNLIPYSIVREDTSYMLPEKYVIINILRYTLLNNNDVARWVVKNIALQKSSHGMSTKEAQIGHLHMKGKQCVDITKLKTSEGKTITNPVEYTVHQWSENFEHYLRNAMSYTNSLNLSEFIGKQKLVVKSEGTRLTVNK